MDLAPVAGCDARALLSPMLQRIQAQIGQIRRFRVAVNGENAALFVEFVEHENLPLVHRNGGMEKVLERSAPRRSSVAELDNPSSMSVRLRTTQSPTSSVTPISQRLDTVFLAPSARTASGFAVETRMRDGPS